MAESGGEVVGRVAAMCIALPDYNQVLMQLDGSLSPFGWLEFLSRSKQVNQGRLWALGVKRKFHNLGFDSLLYYESFMGASEFGYQRGEVSWILEDNTAIICPILMWSGKVYKACRVYHRAI